MTELNQTLPLLPLTSGVALPGMVFTLALETDEARSAADAAGAAGGQLVLVPHVDGRYAPIGVVAEIVEVGDLPGGPRAMVVRATERVTIGTAVPGTGTALWVQVEPVNEGPVTPRSGRAGPGVPGRPREHPDHPRGAADGRKAARGDRALVGGRPVGLLARPDTGPEGRDPGDGRRRWPGCGWSSAGPGRPSPT